MKLIVEKAPLIKALNHVQSVVERRTTIPILSNVVLRAEGERLSLAATDMDIEIVEAVPASVQQGGAITVPARTIYDIARKLRDGVKIEMETIVSNKASEVALRAGRSSFRLLTLPVEDYPTMSVGELNHHFTMPAADLRMLIDRIRFAISTEETRYYLCGIYFHATGVGAPGDQRWLRGVATDGHRLARLDVPLPDGAAGMPGVILPRKTVGELRKLIDDADSVLVGISESKIRFSAGEAVLTSKVIDGTFPDYDRVIPINNDKLVAVPREEFTGAVDRVATISAERTRAIKLEINKGGLTLSSSSPEGGTATEELNASYDREPISIGFNSRYLMDIADQVEGETLELVMDDSCSPTLIRDSGNAGSLFVIMPMRV